MNTTPGSAVALVGVSSVASCAACGDERERADGVELPVLGVPAEKESEGRMFLGLRTVVYQVDDLGRAKEWYSRVLGIEPYFDEPFYVGFNVGGFELGLHPADEETPLGAGGALAYWGVEDIAAVVARLAELGAPVHSEIQDVGDGILVASVVDPFGNLLGIIQNPHFGK